MKELMCKLAVAFTVVFLLSGCAKESEYDSEPIKNPIRVLIANEGQFTQGTASLTALMYDGTVKNDVFRTANNRPLGDVAQSITQVKNNFYVTLNNSRKIEVMDDKTFLSVETILAPDASIPTYMCHLGGDSMAVSEKGSKGRLMILDLNHGKKREPIRRIIDNVGSANQMSLNKGKLFIGGGTTLRVFTLGHISTASMRKIQDPDGKNIAAAGDSKLITDKNGNLWVLTSTRLICINPQTEACIKVIPLTGITVGSWDGRIDISPNGESLYFTGRIGGVKGIVGLNINDSSAPTQLLFPLTDVRVIYNMAVSKEGTIFVCDVLYGSIARGLVHEFSKTGEKIKTIEAGIFPQYIHFLN